MIKKCSITMVLVVALIAFGFVHDVRADAAGFGGTGTVASWGGAANSGGSNSGSSESGGSNPGRPMCRVPEPSSLILLASALAGLIVMVALRKRVRVK